jgi:hypothetical protein
MSTSAIPILEQIRQDLLKTISGITIAGGYTFDAICDEPDRLGNATGEGVVILDLGNAERNQEISANGLLEWVQEFIFTGYTVQSETNYSPWDGLNILKYADINKAIQVDYQRGGWAHDTLPEAPAWFKREDDKHEGVAARAYVRYRTAYSDPYSIR